MADYRAPRTWHIEERFDRFYVVNQFGGFSGWSNTLEDAIKQGREYVRVDGDRFEGVDG